MLGLGTATIGMPAHPTTVSYRAVAVDAAVTAASAYSRDAAVEPCAALRHPKTVKNSTFSADNTQLRFSCEVTAPPNTHTRDLYHCEF